MIIFITSSILPYLREKAQLSLDFFDRLGRLPFWQPSAFCR